MPWIRLSWPNSGFILEGVLLRMGGCIALDTLIVLPACHGYGGCPGVCGHEHLLMPNPVDPAKRAISSPWEVPEHCGIDLLVVQLGR